MLNTTGDPPAEAALLPTAPKAPTGPLLEPSLYEGPKYTGATAKDGFAIKASNSKLFPSFFASVSQSHPHPSTLLLNVKGCCLMELCI